VSAPDRFYEVRTEAGTFWIRAARASDAYRLARQIMAADPQAIDLSLAHDMGFTDPDERGLDYNQAHDRLRELSLTVTGADHVLVTARVQGVFDEDGLTVRRISISPERFEVINKP
jgi:hypothetical protein